ncbi:MAG: hypothetical protein BGP06_17135 [Rhizobiales bacterium 65-9]|nr:hypothetical protein [Hyphomicrobiales bacterium]OJY38153.1 MAG: hypothetical protein BGP06_17135 [Rhizobiales bacterium 65-9]
MNDRAGADSVKAERLAAALRANLRRRKQQARGRSEAAEPPPEQEAKNAAPAPAREKPGEP